MLKIVKMTSAFLVAGALVTGCASGTTTTTSAGTSAATAAAMTTAAATTAASSQAGLELTLEELAKFNRKDGNPAYVAVDGIIYDVSASPAWKNGGHNGFEAGKDLTNEIKTISPHGVVKLENVPEVGRIVE